MSQDQIEFYLIKHGVLSPRGKSGDPAMARSNVDDSSTGRSTQPAMSRNTRELATSLVEMKIASRDLPMPDAGASQGEDNQQPPGDGLDSLNPDPPSVYSRQVREDDHVDLMNVDALPTDPLADAGDDADSAEDHLLEARHHVQVHEEAPLTGEGDIEQEQSDPSSRDRSMSKDNEEAPLTGEGVSQEEQCDLSSRDHPMTDARPIDPVDTGVTEEHSNPSPAGVTTVVPFVPPPPTTQPEETPQSSVEPTRMNDEVADDTMRDLEPFSPPPKDLVLCPQPLAVREVIDLDLVPGDSNIHSGDCNLNDPDVRVDEDALPQQRKGKARLRQALDASFDVGAASAPPNTRSKEKEGPSTARRGMEGTTRKDKERPTLAGQKQSRGVGMKEQVREHLERELAKKKSKEPPSRSALYLEAVRQAQEVVYKEYVASILFTNNFEKNNVPDADV